MTSCCEAKKHELTTMRAKHSRVLWAVLIINIIMFLVEGIFGWLAHSTSLLADALDMFGDALVYGFSLLVLTRSAKWQAMASLTKGIFMLAFGLGVLVEAIYKTFFSTIPDTTIMGIIGSLALIANIICFYLLYQYRDDNLNMSSTWLCSRNDLIANLGVLLAASFCYLLMSRWPDILVGSLIVVLFLRSAVKVLTQSLKAFRTSES